MNHKWTLFIFSRGDFKTLERYLNEQAEQGWELEKTGIVAKWKRAERNDLTYCVDLAKPRQDRQDRKEYADFCREGGWELTAFVGNMYVFKSRPGERPIPIQTDPELEKKNYNRYYIRNSILSVVLLAAYLCFFSLLGADALGAFQELSNQWMTDWLGASLYAVLPLWGLWAVWKLADFARATVKGRTGRIGHSPRWVMWANCVMALIFGIGAALLYIGMALEFLFGAKMFSYVVVFLFVWSGVFLWRAFEMEGELFRGERRRYVKLGVSMLLIFALLVAGRIMAPYGQWDTNPYGADDDAMEKYALLEDVPIVRGEDIGLPLSEEMAEYFYLTHEVIPMGELWKLENYYRYPSSGLDATGCETYAAPTVWLAERLVDMKVEQAAQSAYLGAYSHDIGVEMAEVKVSWADEAWYGELHFPIEEKMLSVLIVRIDNQVTYLAAHAPLMTEERLPAIEARLCR